jgi:hypothetical protein
MIARMRKIAAVKYTTLFVASAMSGELLGSDGEGHLDTSVLDFSVRVFI